MKRLAMFLVFATMFAVSASALIVSAPNLGGAQQDRNANLTASFTITNDGTLNLSNLRVSVTPGTAYLLSVPSTTFNLTTGQSTSITLSGFIPLSHSAVNPSTLNAEPLAVATVTVTGTDSTGATITQTANVTAQAKNQLELKKTRIQCSTTSKSLDNGDRIKNLKPGEDCTLEVEVENLFGDDTNGLKTSGVEFRSIDIRVDSSSNDVDVDDDNDDIENLDGGDEDTLTFDLEIEEDADAKTVSIDIRVSGTDENGAIHGEQRTVRMEIERLTHDIQIKTVELSPSRVSNCEASNVKLGAHISNLGKRNDRNVVIEASAPDLKFTKKTTPFELDKDDETSVSFDVPVAKGQKHGVVRVDVNSFFDTVAPSNSAAVELTVEECGADEKVEDEPVVVQPKTTPTTTTPPVVTPTSGTAAAPKKQSQSFTESTGYVVLLVVVSVVILAVLIGMVTMLARRRQA